MVCLYKWIEEVSSMQRMTNQHFPCQEWFCLEGLNFHKINRKLKAWNHPHIDKKNANLSCNWWSNKLVYQKICLSTDPRRYKCSAITTRWFVLTGRLLPFPTPHSFGIVPNTHSPLSNHTLMMEEKFWVIYGPNSGKQGMPAHISDAELARFENNYPCGWVWFWFEDTDKIFKMIPLSSIILYGSASILSVIMMEEWH